MSTNDSFTGFAHHPVEVVAEWRSKTVATRTPEVGWHEQWQLDFRFECTSSPILLALIVQLHNGGTYDRLHRSNADHAPSLRLSFAPRDWFESDVVDITLSQSGQGGSALASTQVRDRQLKSDPRDVVNVPVAASATTQTGGVCHLAAVPSLGFTAKVVVLAKSDTENARARWRVRNNFAEGLPELYGFLLQGRLSGDLPVVT